MQNKIFLLVMSLIFLFSCDPHSQENVVLEVLAYGDTSSTEGSMWISIVDSFETKYPHIDIQYTLLDEPEFSNTALSRILLSDYPDVTYLGNDEHWGSLWDDAGQTFDHTDLIDTNIFDINKIQTAGLSNERWTIPLSNINTTSVLFANSTLLTTLSLAMPQSYADLVSMVPTAQAAGKRVISFSGNTSWTSSVYFVSVFVARLSGDPLWMSKAVAGFYSFNDPNFVAAIQLVKTMVDDGVFGPDVENMDSTMSLSEFNLGNALFYINGQWAVNSIDPGLADNVLMVPFPAIPGQAAGTPNYASGASVPGYGLTVSGAADLNKQDAAMKFIEYFHQEPYATTRVEAGLVLVPVLKNFTCPQSLSTLKQRRFAFLENIQSCQISDQFLPSAANQILDNGMLDVIAGTLLPSVLASNIESSVRP